MLNIARCRMKGSLCRAMIVSAVSLVLIAVSFHGGLDEFTQEKVAETTNETIGIYVVSRAINALVSMLQTSQFNVPFLGSMQFGQVLDPVNDAVERLSSTVVWAVGSLFVQRILLEVAASLIFKWTLFSIGVATVAALLLMEWSRARMWCCRMSGVTDRGLERGRDWLVRSFVVVAIFRLIIPLFIGASFLVSQIFLESEITKNREQLSVLRTQVSNVASLSSPDSGSLEEKTGEEERMRGFEESKAEAVQEIERLDTRIGQLTDEAGWRRVLPELLGGVSPGDELRAARERRREVDQKIERIEDAIGESNEALECIDRRIAGGSCDSLLDRISKAGTAGMSQVREMLGELSEMVTEITMLLIAIVIQNILFPIVFLMGAVKFSLPIARHLSRLLSGFEGDARKLKDTVTSHVQGRGSHLERLES